MMRHLGVGKDAWLVQPYGENPEALSKFSPALLARSSPLGTDFDEYGDGHDHRVRAAATAAPALFAA